ncbi:hypothetical protein ACTGJ9_020910 [Bradyrhizobium sp. RDM12]
MKKEAPFIDDTAAKTGKHRATIARDVARAEALGDDIDRVAGTSLDKGAELDALAAMPADDKAPLIQRALACLDTSFAVEFSHQG